MCLQPIEWVHTADSHAYKNKRCVHALLTSYPRPITSLMMSQGIVKSTILQSGHNNINCVAVYEQLFWLFVLSPCRPNSHVLLYSYFPNLANVQFLSEITVREQVFVKFCTNLDKHLKMYVITLFHFCMLLNFLFM